MHVSQCIITRIHNSVLVCDDARVVNNVHELMHAQDKNGSSVMYTVTGIVVPHATPATIIYVSVH